MRILRGVLLTAVVSALLFIPSAMAQATRTWVSGVGDDANPCSRTAPCKTFAGAISKTAAGGEISTLDPGGFGVVTITKSITISGDGTLSSILSAGTNAIIVNTTASDQVVLRNLSIIGVGTGLNGVRFIGAGKLVLEHLTIESVTGFGVDFEPTGASESRLVATDVIATRAAGGGFLIKPGAGAFARATLTRVQGSFDGDGLRAENRSVVGAADSVFSDNSANGSLSVLNGSGGAGPNVFLDGCKLTSNGGGGSKTDGAGATTRLTRNTIFANASGMTTVNGGTNISFGDNSVAGNAVEGTPTITVARI